MPVYLMYHEIELPGRAMCQSEPGYVRYVVPESAFRVQLLWLKQNGWQGVSVGQALQHSDVREIVITFDDGCESDLITAAPLLSELGFRATFYIAVNFLDKPGFLSRSQLRQLSNQGFEIGCHSMTHPHLDDLDQRQLRYEIADSKTALEQVTGLPVEHFSCPGGRWNRRVVEVARAAGYRSMATSRASANASNTDSFSLGRVVVMRGTKQPKFQRLCEGQGLWSMRLQDSSRTLAKRFLGNTIYDRLRSGLLLRRIR
jgi:peptidoglycan/xylan/chitin deacetylase (PgdA/CDA1 family)